MHTYYVDFTPYGVLMPKAGCRGSAMMMTGGLLDTKYMTTLSVSCGSNVVDESAGTWGSVP